MKTISILGSTGSIGTQTLTVVRSLSGITVAGLAANSNIDLLEQQVTEFNPKVVAAADERAAGLLNERLKGRGISVLAGAEGVKAVASMGGCDTVVNALTGVAGLLPTVAAIEAGHDVALANKETLVAAGELVMRPAEKRGVKILPVDSEHSAVWQCLGGGQAAGRVKTIYLTASGGPFRSKSREQLKNVTAKDALRHPNWSMGAKVTVDSATLMNKGLEVIEARWLFNVPEPDVKVLVHPQSVIHSMVEFTDGSVIAQLGEPDMRLPIQYALTWPERVENRLPRINFFERNNLTFEPPDVETFPCLRLAYEALKAGGTMPAVLNGANEAAVSLFLAGKISFLHIPELIDMAMSAYTVEYDYDLAGVVKAGEWAAGFVIENAAGIIR